jgi:hypothetical protein
VGLQFEIRSIDPQFRVEVCSSSIVTSLQVLDHRRRLPLVQKGRQLSKHFLGEITDLLVPPFLGLGEREDRRQLFRRQAAGVYARSVRISGMMLSVTLAGRISIVLNFPLRTVAAPLLVFIVVNPVVPEP